LFQQFLDLKTFTPFSSKIIYFLSDALSSWPTQNHQAQLAAFNHLDTSINHCYYYSIGVSIVTQLSCFKKILQMIIITSNWMAWWSLN